MAVISASCLLIPIITFELYKLGSLGGSGYIQHWREFAEIFAQASGASTMSSDLTSRFPRYIAMFQAGFNISLLGAVATAAATVAMLWNSSTRATRTLALFLFCGAFVHLSWWSVVAMPNTRYALIGVCLYVAALGLIVYSRPMNVAVGGAVLLIFLHMPRSLTPFLPPEMAFYGGMWDPARLPALREAAEVLKSEANSRPFVTGSWQVAADLEYILPGVANFRWYKNLMPADAERNWILVRNTTWTNLFPVPEFAAWEERCSKVVFHRNRYVISRCPSQKEQLRMLRRLAPQGLAKSDLRIKEGEIELATTGPSIYRLELAPSERRIQVGYGIDAPQQSAAAQALCFVIEAKQGSGVAIEILRDCLNAAESKTRRPARIRTLNIPPNTKSLEFITESNAVGKTYWAEIKAIPGNPE